MFDLWFNIFLRFEHWDMAEALNESLTLEELEISEIEERASIPNCSCRSNCIRERGRNFCPCKSQGQYCSNVCHDGNSLCLNNRRAVESNSDDSSVSFFGIKNCQLYCISNISKCL